VTTATREYLQDVVRTFEQRLKVRGHSRAAGKLRKWEYKIFRGARSLLVEEQQDIPGSSSFDFPASAKDGL
jgi:hypothetical protein